MLLAIATGAPAVAAPHVAYRQLPHWVPIPASRPLSLPLFVPPLLRLAPCPRRLPPKGQEEWVKEKGEIEFMR